MTSAVIKMRDVIILGLVLIATTVPAVLAANEQVSLCELVKQGQEMNGMPVRISAIYFTDMLEHSGLKDRRCPALVLAPFDSNEKPRDPSMDKFDKAVMGKVTDLELRQFSIDVSGTFIWRANELPHGALVMKKIWGFKRIGSAASESTK